MLQAVNIDKISASIPQVAPRCPQLEEHAQTVAKQWFSKGHNKFNTKKGLAENDLDT